MTRKAFVLGFGSCEKKVDFVSERLSEFYGEDIPGLSFRQANSDSEKLDRLTKGAEVFTHSAGMTAIHGMRPKAIHAIAPPLPTPVLSLIKRAGSSGHDLRTTEGFSPARREQMLEFRRDLVSEVRKHPIANLGKIALISAFSAVESGIAAKESGIDVDLAFMLNDKLFQMSEAQRVRAFTSGLSFVLLQGSHEEFVCDPAGVVEEYEKVPELIVV